MDVQQQEYTVSRKLASRKFILSTVVVIIFTVLRVYNLLSEELFADAVVWISGLYIAGNVTHRFMGGVYDKLVQPLIANK